jgi:hypothetical protein
MTTRQDSYETKQPVHYRLAGKIAIITGAKRFRLSRHQQRLLGWEPVVIPLAADVQEEFQKLHASQFRAHCILEKRANADLPLLL